VGEGRGVSWRRRDGRDGGQGEAHLEELDGFGDDIAACAVDDGVEVGARWGKHLFQLWKLRE